MRLWNFKPELFIVETQGDMSVRYQNDTDDIELCSIVQVSTLERREEYEELI